jgi:hypothetical protein
MRQRLIILAVVATIALLGFWTLDRLYVEPMRAAEVRVAELSEQLAALRERELAARKDRAELSDTERARHPNLAIAAPDLATATARFQEYARASVAETGGVTASSQTAIAGLPGGYSKVSVLLRLRFAEAQLLEFARKIETDSPPVVIEALEVRPLPIAGDSRPLDVTATISGFYGGADAP